MILKCLRCGQLGLENVGSAWRCQSCKCEYPVIGKVARFVPEQFYTESFGFQWNRFARTQLDSANGTTQSRDTFMEKTGWSLADLGGKRILDAGCGMGRFAEICAAAGAEVHAVDLSAAVDAACQNLGHRHNVHIYQADIMNLPFTEGSFDAVYSIGVLHHTPSTQAAFAKLPPLLKPGGIIALWVYSAELRALVGGEILRKLTTQLPKSLLLQVCRIAVPLYHLHRIPKLGVVTTILFPTSIDTDPEWRWLDTFDWYSPRYQWKHTYEEVERWFRAAGLTDIQRGSFPVSVRGIRPPSQEIARDSQVGHGQAVDRIPGRTPGTIP